MTGRSAEALARIRELQGDRSPRADQIRRVEARVAALDPDPDVHRQLAELAAPADRETIQSAVAMVGNRALELHDAATELRLQVEILSRRSSGLTLDALAADLARLSAEAARIVAASDELRGWL